MSDGGEAVDRDVRADVLVAGAAAASSVGLSLVSRVLLDLPVGFTLRLSPLLVYPLYVLLGRGDTGSVVEDPRPWALASVVVAFAAMYVALN